MWAALTVVTVVAFGVLLYAIHKHSEAEADTVSEVAHSTVRFYLSEGSQTVNGERDFFVVEPILDPTPEVASLARVGRRVKAVDLTLDEYGEIVGVNQRPF